MRRLHVLPVLLAGCLVAACGGSGSMPAASTAPTASPSPPPPSPTASRAPDVERVEIIAAGLGTYLETAYPVVLLRNASKTRTATEVTVHVAVLTPAGREAAHADAVLGRLAPGAVSALAQRLALVARGDHLVASVVAARFVLGAPADSLRVDGAALSCRGCAAPGGGSGDVHGTLSGSGTAGAATVALDAACLGAQGQVVGGGHAEVAVSGAAAEPVDVPVIVDGVAASCRVDASPGGF